jgi:AcrR family transcriptional regulator
MANSTTKPSRTQEERSAETRSKLLDATVGYLIELGYHRTTTSLICERAGLSRGALLHHFPTKERLVIDAIWHLFAERTRELDFDFEKLKTPEQRLEALLDQIWSAFFSVPIFWAASEKRNLGPRYGECSSFKASTRPHDISYRSPAKPKDRKPGLVSLRPQR